MTVGSTADLPAWRVVARDPAAFRRGRPLGLLALVLARAADHHHPPVERAVLLARFSRQLNDLFVAGGPDGGFQAEVLRGFRAEHDRLLYDEVLPELRERGITVVRWEQVNAAERNRLRNMFHEVIYPLATPMVVDSSHPFPHLAGMPLNIGVFVRDRRHGTERFACVPLPERLFGLDLLSGGFVRIGVGRLIGVEVVVLALVEGLFHGMQVLEKSTFRVVRDYSAVRPISPTPCSTMCLEVEETMSERMLNVLVCNLNVGAGAVCRERAPLALAERIVRVSEALSARHGRYRHDRPAPIAARRTGLAAARRTR